MELQTIQTTTTWNDASSRINANNVRIATEITKLGAATYKNLGYFRSLDALKDAYPIASNGAKAYVGTYPYAIFLWGNAGWETRGEVGGEETVGLGDYYTKEEMSSVLGDYSTKNEIEEAIDDYHVLLSESEYENLAIKQEKLYLCYEDEENE